jgi:hypothetical protein
MIPQIIDNYLSEERFKELQTNIVWNTDFPWYLNNNVVSGKVEDPESSYYATHIVYYNCKPLSNIYEKFIPLINSLPNFRSLLRVKVNFYPRTSELYEHDKHVDYDFEHKGAILSLNTCDGFTRLEDGTIVDSVANRLLLFDSSKPHNSSTTTDPKCRFNININYL